MNSDAVYRMMFESVKTGDLQKNIATAYEITGRPLIITDTSYKKLTEVYPPVPQGDTKWDVYLPDEELDLDSIIHIFQNNYLEQMQAPFEPVLMDRDYFQDSPRLTAPIVIEDNLVGYVSMLCGEEGCGDQEKEMLQIVADAVAIYLRGYEGERYDKVTLQQILSGKLLSGKLQEGDELDRWKEFYNLDIEPPYTVFLVKSTSSYSFLQSRIGALDLPVMSYQDDGRIYLLASRVRDKGVLDLYVRQIFECAWGIRISVGVSKSFNDLSRTGECRAQAEKALELGEKLDRSASVYYYQDMIISAAIDAAVQSLGVDSCMHPGIGVLSEYDQRHGTEYLNTLRFFLYDAGNHVKICSGLHIHRNTLNYRLNKIFAMIGADREDPAHLFHLYMSFRILDDTEIKKP